MPGLRSRLITLTLLPAGLACGADPVRWVSSSELASIVLVDEIQGSARPRVTLYQDPDQVYVEALSPGTHGLFSLGFRQPLANLATPLELDELGVELPAPDEMRQLLVGSEAASPWQKIPELPTRIASLKFKTSTPCVHLRAGTPNTIPSQQQLNPALFLPLGEGRFLLGTDVGPFFKVTSETVELLTKLSSSTPHKAGLVDPSGQIWLFGEDGVVVRGSAALDFVPEAPRPLASSPLRQVVQSRDGRPFEVFTLTADQGVEHFDGQRWSVLRWPRGLPVGGRELSLGWVKQGMVAVIESQTAIVTELNIHGIEEVRPLDLPQTHLTLDSVHVLGYLDGVGAFVGSDYGVAFRRGAEGWRMLQPQTSNRVEHFHSLQSAGYFGGLWGGRNGEYVQWYDGFDGACPLVLIPNQRNYEFVEPTGTDGDFLAVNGAPDGGSMSVTLLHRVP
jgi:hypothetical protein